jgi:hypothetical protein
MEQIDREALAARITPHDTEARRQAYREGKFPRAAAVKDLNRRYRWDLFYVARPYDLTEGFPDARIETALRRIIPPIV